MDLYADLKKRKILLLEIDPWIRDALAMYLGERGCFVAVLSGIPAGRFVVDGDCFDIVICDHRPPELDGVGYLAEVRLALPQAILILLTAEHPGTVLLQAGAAGIDDVIQKPFVFETMEKSFERALQGRHRMEALHPSPPG